MPIRPLLSLLLAVALCAGEAATAAAPAPAPAPNPATGPITRGQRIFAVHHSFHEGGFYPILTRISEAAGIADASMVGNFYIGGSTVIQHWNGPSGTAAKAALTAGQVDVLTTTPIYLPDQGPSTGVIQGPGWRMQTTGTVIRVEEA